MSKYTYEDKLAFISNLYCPARVVAAETGCSWELILAQAAQETGWGEKVLAGTNNIFNIKADPSWTGPTKVFRVWEEVNGKIVWQDDPFRVYPNTVAALRDRVKFLQENKRYAKAGLFDPGVKGDLQKEAQALKDGGYATASNYATELVKVAHGPTMRRAIKQAQEKGCGPVLPVVEVILLDGAKVPLAKVKVALTQDGKQAEVTTDAMGRFIVRITPKSGDISLKVFDPVQHKWLDLEPVKMPSPVKSTTVTLISPNFTVRTSSREHDKAPSSSPAPAPAPAPKPKAGEVIHTVKAGESLAVIGKQYKVSYKAIADANKIASPFIIRPGDHLKIPQAAKAGSAGSKPAPAASHEPGWMEKAEKTLSEVLNNSSNALHSIFYRNEEKKPQTDVMHASQAPWLKFAEEEFKADVKRIKGAQHDPHIVQYFQATSIGNTADGKKDETPYCAAFVNWCLAKSGYKGNNSAWSPDFAKWGRATRGNKPALGAVACIKFPKGNRISHVTFVTGIKKNGRICTLGGNQGDANGVTHSAVPASWVVEYRYPADYPDLDADYELHEVKTDNAQMSHASTR